jgi:hypothetical protein
VSPALAKVIPGNGPMVAHMKDAYLKTQHSFFERLLFLPELSTNLIVEIFK